MISIKKIPFFQNAISILNLICILIPHHLHSFSVRFCFREKHLLKHPSKFCPFTSQLVKLFHFTLFQAFDHPHVNKRFGYKLIFWYISTLLAKTSRLFCPL